MRTRSITRAAESPEVKVNRARRMVRAIVNSEDIDGHGTVIDPAGVDLDVYRRNPVVLLDHGQDVRYGRIPVGRTLDIDLVSYPAGSRRRAIRATVQFREDPESDRVWQAYADQTMRGFSVNVIPYEATPPSQAEIRSRPELRRCSLIYRQTELRELSAVSVPSNPSALALEVERSLAIPPVPRSRPEAIALLAREGRARSVRRLALETLLLAWDDVAARRRIWAEYCGLGGP